MDKCALGDVLTLTMGQSPPGDTCNTSGIGVPLLNGPTEFGSRNPVPAQWTADARRLCKESAVLLCVRGSTTGRTNRADQSYAIGRGVAAIEAEDSVDQSFSYFALLSSLDVLLERTTGSVFPNLSRDDIASLQLPWPHREVRRAISEVLEALDDKIEANRRLIGFCDELWQAAAGQLFDTIEDGFGELGSLQPLSSIAQFINGKAFTKNATGTGRMVVRIAELNSGPGPSTVYNDIEVATAHLANPGDLLFAWSGSLTIQRWFCPEAIINQHIFKVVPEPGIPMWCIHAQLLRLLAEFQRIAAGKATTMGHIQRHDLDVEIEVPSGDALSELDGICGPLWRRALEAERETLALSALRDALLPKLMSGELRVMNETERLTAVSI